MFSQPHWQTTSDLRTRKRLLLINGRRMRNFILHTRLHDSCQCYLKQSAGRPRHANVKRNCLHTIVNDYLLVAYAIRGKRPCENWRISEMSTKRTDKILSFIGGTSLRLLCSCFVLDVKFDRQLNGDVFSFNFCQHRRPRRRLLTEFRAVVGVVSSCVCKPPPPNIKHAFEKSGFLFDG